MNTKRRPQAFAHKWKAVLGVVLPTVLLSGCQNMNNTEAGALGGGAIGAVFGTLIGAACHAPLAGAAIGAGVGATAGAVSGNREDRWEHRNERLIDAAVQRGQIELEEVAKMTRDRVDENIILSHIRNSGALFSLSAEQIAWLKQNNVSPTVIQYMVDIGRQNIYYAPVRQPVVVVEPPPPGVYVGVGGGYYTR